MGGGVCSIVRGGAIMRYWALNCGVLSTSLWGVGHSTIGCGAHYCGVWGTVLWGVGHITTGVGLSTTRDGRRLRI